MTKRLGTAAAAAILLAISLVLSGCTASRLDPAGGVDARAVLEEFKGRGMEEHLEALQRIADDNDGNRASGTSGYEESARYVEERLRAAGYTPVRQAFTLPGRGQEPQAGGELQHPRRYRRQCRENRGGGRPPGLRA